MEKSMGSPNGAEISSFLGIDYGKSKIGLATADSETRMAFAFDTLANDKYFLENLKGIVFCENVKEIIIGMTRHGNDPESVDEKMKFAENIKKELNLPVNFQDEMFSTKIARENIKKRGGRNIDQFDDQEAARIILQEWLDKTHKS